MDSFADLLETGMKYLTLLLLAAVIGCSETARGLNDGIVDASQATVDGVADAPWGGLQIQSVGTPLEDSDQIVVLLHGYGATESDLIPLAGYIGGDRRAFVFPAGPVSVDGGGLAWGTTEAELRTAHARLAALVRFVSQTYPNAEIAVGGFSQGATLSSLLLSDSTLPIQHLILYSPAFVLEAGTLDPARDIHVLLAHGRRDEVLPFTDSKLMQEMLESEGVQTNWLPFDDGHTITTEVLDATRDQLSK